MFFVNKLFEFLKKNATVFFIFLIILITNFNIQRWNSGQVIKWDVTSYYAYLPATFIHNDLSLDFVDEKKDFYTDNHMFWPEETPDGKKVIKTTMGLSILYAPFFAIAHLKAKLSNNEANGFSTPYHKWVHLSALFYLFLGLLCLNSFLKKYFDAKSAFVSIASVLLGTNLFYYSTTEAAMSHVFNFSLLSIFIYFFDKWFHKANIKNSLIIGLSLGLLVLIRPTNILVLLFALFYKVDSFESILNNLKLFLIRNFKYLVLIFILCCIIIFPQFFYWKAQTGNWIYNSYTGETFYFNNPHLIDMFFGFRKGWLIYSPLMLFSILGFGILFKKHKELFFSTLFPFIILSFIFSSWWCWWYGGSFGLRAMIDVYAYLTIPFTAFVSYLFSIQSKLLKGISFGVLVVFIALNLYQTDLYRKGIIHWDSMTKAAYFESFGEKWKSEKMEELYKAPDYWNAKEGKEEYSK